MLKRDSLKKLIKNNIKTKIQKKNIKGSKPSAVKANSCNVCKILNIAFGPYLKKNRNFCKAKSLSSYEICHC